MSPAAVIPPSGVLGADGVRGLSDDELIEAQLMLAAERRRIDASSAVVAGELARRSARDLGFGGLAQRHGARTPERLVSTLTGVSVGEARAMVRVGQAMNDGTPWLGDVTARVAAGEVSVAAAAAIRAGLGEPSADVDAEVLARAASRVVAEAGQLPPDKVVQHARAVRDELEVERVSDREALLRERRFLRLTPLGDGMMRISGLLDPESAALVTDAVDRVTAPRRGGVRFVDPAEQARAAALRDDARSTDQLALDALVQMIRLAAAVDDGAIFGVRSPAVRVHVTAADLARGAAAAEIEGQTTAVGMATVQRIVCAGGFLPVMFEGGRAIDLGRTQRLHSARQRVAIAARDGGCLAPGCDRPPSWCEVHHIVPWSEGGGTSVDDGVLLCAHHHRWVHDTGRRIERRGGEYRLLELGGARVRLESKGRLRARSEPAA